MAWKSRNIGRKLRKRAKTGAIVLQPAACSQVVYYHLDAKTIQAPIFRDSQAISCDAATLRLRRRGHSACGPAEAISCDAAMLRLRRHGHSACGPAEAISCDAATLRLHRCRTSLKYLCETRRGEGVCVTIARAFKGARRVRAHCSSETRRRRAITDKARRPLARPYGGIA